MMLCSLVENTPCVCVCVCVNVIVVYTVQKNNYEIILINLTILRTYLICKNSSLLGYFLLTLFLRCIHSKKKVTFCYTFMFFFCFQQSIGHGDLSIVCRVWWKTTLSHTYIIIVFHIEFYPPKNTLLRVSTTLLRVNSNWAPYDIE